MRVGRKRTSTMIALSVLRHGSGPGPEASFVLSVTSVRQRVETMGIRPLKQGSSLEDRLYELCVDWGFCIPSADAKRIASTKSLTADQSAYAVLTAEGFVADSHFANGLRRALYPLTWCSGSGTRRRQQEDGAAAGAGADFYFANGGRRRLARRCGF
jgi:hypothetical protein